ncbi:MAG: ABC transporter ATP-binding protein [Chloroflexi bacterium]|nr:ABC transporter ATP-binding protein [Chloroflexota bacterium]
MDVRDWNSQALRSQISIIEQDIFSTAGQSPKISPAKSSATIEEIIEAAKKAQAHAEFLHQQPRKVATRPLSASAG